MVISRASEWGAAGIGRDPCARIHVHLPVTLPGPTSWPVLNLGHLSLPLFILLEASE